MVVNIYIHVCYLFEGYWCVRYIVDIYMVFAKNRKWVRIMTDRLTGCQIDPDLIFSDVYYIFMIYRMYNSCFFCK